MALRRFHPPAPDPARSALVREVWSRIDPAAAETVAGLSPDQQAIIHAPLDWFEAVSRERDEPGALLRMAHHLAHTLQRPDLAEREPEQIERELCRWAGLLTTVYENSSGTPVASTFSTLLSLAQQQVRGQYPAEDGT